MKRLNKYIKEELDDNNILWLLDKWFETNESQKHEFMELLAKCIADKIVQTKNLEDYIKQTSFEQNLKEFVNFIDNDVQPEDEKNYFENLRIILQFVINFKDKRNKYVDYKWEVD